MWWYWSITVYCLWNLRAFSSDLLHGEASGGHPASPGSSWGLISVQVSDILQHWAFWFPYWLVRSFLSCNKSCIYIVLSTIPHFTFSFFFSFLYAVLGSPITEFLLLSNAYSICQVDLESYYPSILPHSLSPPLIPSIYYPMHNIAGNFRLLLKIPNDFQIQISLWCLLFDNQLVAIPLWEKFHQLPVHILEVISSKFD